MTLLHRLISFEAFFALRPTRGSALRIAADASSLWAAFLFGWFFIEDQNLAALAAQETKYILPFLGLFSLLTFITYVDAGLYTCPHGYSLTTKISRIARINLVLLIIGGVVLAFAPPSLGITPRILLTTLTGATLLACVARMISAVLRSEDRETGGSVAHESPDESRILVIGGAGYIGSALVEKLLNLGKHVTVLDAMHYGDEPLARVAGHPELTIVREDFRHIEVLTRVMSGIGAVIHLGGLVGDPACAVDPDLTVDINVTATKLVGEIAKARGAKRFIFASSCSVYGACDEAVDETSHFNPQSLYARSKVASEALLGALDSDDFAVTCLRFATVYGISGRTRFDLVANLLCAKAVRDGVITVFGADQWRPFVHVDDVARAIMTALTAPVERVAGEVFNVGSDTQNYTLGELAALIKAQVPDARVVSDDNCTDKRNYRVSFAKIRDRLGFEPAWTLERGIAQVISVVRSNEVGHYSLPTYSNVLYLKECGSQSFGSFKITGWETEYMNIDRIAPSHGVRQTAAA
ncbi:MAG: NAD-dependent epimerase/dehydratase family protein [Candidatus Afipia apatlaquensis]|uniref:NAD-dependent epimerase/dehydratase family protein n=1 Tax=Candidatus Afipia apatlaquensis TaxID=2712852 RepID=A0A7C9RIY1_9BRAD|nr:NAD-dependent epimerase/dehydratase family protein [Candidatus Afipia apatlaquensis]